MAEVEEGSIDFEHEGEQEIGESQIEIGEPEQQEQQENELLKMIPLIETKEPEQENQEQEQNQNQENQEKQEQESEEEEQEGGGVEEDVTYNNKLKEFYKLRSKTEIDKAAGKVNKNKGTYTKTGDLKIVFEKSPPIAIPMPNYRPLTREELFNNIDNYKKNLSKAEKAYNDAHRMMRGALLEKDSVKIKNAMIRLQELDILLQRARFPNLNVVTEDVPMNKLLFDNSKDETKLVIKRFIGSLKQQYVTSEPAPEEITPVEANVRIINVPEDLSVGILSPFYQFPTSFTINDMTFTSSYKAILTLLAEALGKQDIVADMEFYDNPRDLIDFDTNIRAGVEPDILEGHLTTILPMVFETVWNTYNEFKEALSLTGDALLVVVPQERPLDSFLGVGIDPNQTELIGNPLMWKGRRQYGVALEQVRQKAKIPV